MCIVFLILYIEKMTPVGPDHPDQYFGHMNPMLFDHKPVSHPGLVAAVSTSHTHSLVINMRHAAHK